MQQYYAKKNSKESLYYRLFFVIIFVISWPMLSNSVRPILSDIVSKIFIKNSWYDIIGNYKLYTKSRDDLRSEIDKLSIDNINNENKIARLQAELSKSDIKNELTDFGKVDSIIAYSLGSEDSIAYDTFIINVGHVDGVAEGSLVYTRGLQPIGKIKEVHKNSSLVELLSKEGNEITGILEKSNERISLIGIGGGAYKAKIKNSITGQVPSVSDKVYSGEDTNMTIGQVVTIEKEKDEDISVIYVRGYYNPSSQSIFFVDR